MKFFAAECNYNYIKSIISIIAAAEEAEMFVF
jgi:hypothetical protein